MGLGAWLAAQEGGKAGVSTVPYCPARVPGNEEKVPLGRWAALNLCLLWVHPNSSKEWVPPQLGTWNKM